MRVRQPYDGTFSEKARNVAESFNRVHYLSQRLERAALARRRRPPRRRPAFYNAVGGGGASAIAVGINMAINDEPAERRKETPQRTAAESDGRSAPRNQQRERDPTTRQQQQPPQRPSPQPKHIHPCVCDLSPSVLRHIDQVTASREILHAKLNRRIQRVNQLLSTRKEDAKQQQPLVKQPTQRVRVQNVRAEVTKKEQIESDVGAVTKRRPTAARTTATAAIGDAAGTAAVRRPRRPRTRSPGPAVDKKITKSGLRTMGKKSMPRRKSRILLAERQSLNWKKTPLIPVAQTKTSILRRASSGYCASHRKPSLEAYKRYKSLTPEQVRERIRRAPSKVARSNRTWTVRLQRSKKVVTSPPLKYKRPAFEAGYFLMMKYRPWPVKKRKKPTSQALPTSGKINRSIVGENTKGPAVHGDEQR